MKTKRMLGLALLPLMLASCGNGSGWDIKTNYTLKYDSGANAYVAYHPDYGEYKPGKLYFKFPDSFRFPQSQSEHYKVEAVAIKYDDTHLADGNKKDNLDEFHAYGPNLEYSQISGEETEMHGDGIGFTGCYLTTKANMVAGDYFIIRFAGALKKDGTVVTQFDTKLTFTFNG